MSLNVGAISGAIVFEDEFSKPIKNAQKSADDFAKNTKNDFEEVESSAKQTQDGIAALMGAFAAFEGVKVALNAAIGFAKMGAELEQTRVAMETFLGSAEKADQVISDLNKFSAVTPFTSDQVVQAGKQLLAFGLQAEDLQETLRAVGDVSAGTGKDFNELASIYGKAMTSGKIQAEELNQLTEAGIPIIDELAKNMNVAKEDIKDMGSQGLISFEDLEKAFQTMTGEGGKFFNLMEKQSKTAAGLMSTLQGTVQQVGAEISEQMLNAAKPALEAVVNATSALLDAWNSLDDDTKELIGTIVLAVGTIGLLGAGIIAGQVAWSAAMAAMAASNVVFMSTLGPIAIAMAAVTVGIIAYKAAQKAARSETEKAVATYKETEKSLDRVSSSIEQMRGLSKDSAKYATLHAEAMSDLAKAARTYGVELDTANTNLDYMLQKQKEVTNAAKADLKAREASLKFEMFSAILIAQRQALEKGRIETYQNLTMVMKGFGDSSKTAADNTALLAKTLDEAARRAEFVKEASAGMDFDNIFMGKNEANRLNILNEQLGAYRAILSSLAPLQDKTGESSKKLDGDFGKVQKGVDDAAKAFRKYNDELQYTEVQSNETANAVSGLFKVFDKDTDWINQISENGVIHTGFLAINKAIGMTAEEADKAAGKMEKAFGQITDAAIKNLEAGFEKAQANLQATADILDFIGDLNSKQIAKQNEEELSALEMLWDQKISITKNGLAEIEFLRDEAWQKEKERLDAEYQARVEQARLDYELKLAQVEQDSADEEQRRVNKELMEESWLRRQREMEQEHMAALDEARQAHSDKTQAIVQAENDNIVQMQADKDAAISALQEKQAEDEKARDKQMAMFKALIAYQQFQVAKQAQLAQVSISFAQSMMMAVQAAATTATIPIVGWALAPVVLATLTTLAAGAYNFSRSAIMAQQFIPPAEVFMARGGMLDGPSHAAGGIAVRAEGGERIIDAERTQRFNDWIDRQTLRPEQNDNRSIVVHVSMAGAHIWGVMDPKTAEMIGEKVAVYSQRKIEQRLR